VCVWVCVWNKEERERERERVWESEWEKERERERERRERERERGWGCNSEWNESHLLFVATYVGANKLEKDQIQLRIDTHLTIFCCGGAVNARLVPVSKQVPFLAASRRGVSCRCHPQRAVIVDINTQVCVNPTRKNKVPPSAWHKGLLYQSGTLTTTSKTPSRLISGRMVAKLKSCLCAKNNWLNSKVLTILSHKPGHHEWCHLIRVWWCGLLWSEFKGQKC